MERFSYFSSIVLLFISAVLFIFAVLIVERQLTYEQTKKSEGQQICFSLKGIEDGAYQATVEEENI